MAGFVHPCIFLFSLFYPLIHTPLRLFCFQVVYLFRKLINNLSMKKLSIHRVRNVVAIAIVGVLFGAAYFSNSTAFKASEVRAGGSENVSGFAWSENIGWISLNSTSDGSAMSYGVNISSLTGTGTFSGNAWSENIGWISFAPSDLAICPSASVAQINWSTGNVTGWARALSGSAGSGWDGCIKFSDDSIGVWNGKGVKIDTATGKFSGYAWGSDVVGWIDFAPTVGGVPITNNAHVPIPCSQSNPATFTWGTCAASCTGNPSPRTVTQTRYGVCNDGSIPAVPIVEECGAPISVTCIATPGNPVCGDSACNYGETSSSCLVDCPPTTKFWQF